MTYEITDETLDNFPNTLAAARAIGLYSQSEVAKAIGVTPQTILKWERGKSTIQKSKRRAAADFIISTGLLAAEGEEDPANEIRDMFIGRIATGPALSNREIDAARSVGVHRAYETAIEAFKERLASGPEMSIGEIDLLVETVQFDARFHPS